MTYTKQTWVNGSGGGTPISAARLNHIEDGLDGAANNAMLQQLGVGLAATERRPITIAPSIDGPDVVASLDPGNVVGLNVTPTFTGDYTGWAGVDVGRVWGQVVYSQVSQLGVITDHRAGLFEAVMSSANGNTLATQICLEADTGLGTDSTGTVTLAEGIRIPAPYRNSGSTATIGTWYGLHIADPGSASAFTTTRYSILVDGGVSRFVGEIDAAGGFKVTGSFNGTAATDMTISCPINIYGTGGYGNVGFSEQASAAPATANYANVYARDNGAGKTQLCVQMPTGSPIVLATEA